MNDLEKKTLTWCNCDHCSFSPVVKSTVTVNTSTYPTNKNLALKVPTTLNILHQNRNVKDKHLRIKLLILPDVTVTVVPFPQ